MAKTSTWSRVAVRTADGSSLFLAPDEIFFLEAEGDDVTLRAARKRRYRTPQTLGQLERRLPCPPFFRCHKSFIVNLAHVRLAARRGVGRAQRRRGVDRPALRG